jgi:predicted small lipoprotein YifL
MLGNEQTKRFCLLLRTCVVMGGVVCALLAACGQKGDLYLPADIPPAQEQGR